ncbi:MAG TPA: hypothetical protein VGB57_12665 [Allosphingosinicella sp.]|jgi:hypothetical protein
MPRPNPLTPEVQAAFLAELRSGTLVVAAAARVGVAVQTLYRRRRRDPVFDAGWTAAAEASFGWGWHRLPGGRWRRQWAGAPTARRLRFGAGRRAAYLEALERKGDRSRAARSARVDPRTVRSAFRTDPDFARAHDSALRRGRARRERAAAFERARAAERMIGIVERIAAAMANPVSAFDRHICRLKRRWRPERPGGWRGPGFVRAPAEAIPELRRKIRRIGLAGWKRSRGRGPPWGPGTIPADA